MFFHVVGSHGWMQVRPCGLYCGVWSEDSTKEDLGSRQERLRQAVGQMSPMQKGNDFRETAGES